ncbi:hypothetical protein [Lactiplantibacillus plantarum]|uniref:hypothetical protein n=1 Tax=Lactiplantibacillus plantarum TaxID=1590 RepID=UPI001F4CC718|nr:hypothetical protein [Lactiplantibacillus plantarum]MCH8631650.1 hypothetical protein [Lactiplantibacillus plantarum]
MDCDPVSITTAPQITPADALLVDLTPFSVKVINKAIPVHLTLKSAYLDTGNHRKQRQSHQKLSTHMSAIRILSRLEGVSANAQR